VRDGVLIAAIEQERITRHKSDGQESLSNRLPVPACLEAAGASLADVDVIVSSFQAASPGGIGLHRPLIERGFSLFDPWDGRHFVVSHHRAHALSALGASGFSEAAVLVCDLAGSTTRDGGDFMVPFAAFSGDLGSLDAHAPLRTECLSIYRGDETSLELCRREYCVPHNAPDVFVQNVASLYDNLSRMVFGKENAHGQLMALASMAAGREAPSPVRAGEIVDTAPDGSLRFRNDWQHRVLRCEEVLDYAPVAQAVQQELARALLVYARRARALTSLPRLAAAGGVFLNIPANAAIAESGLFESYYVPSAPHDAGIAIGCAYAGWRQIAGGSTPGARPRAIDRLGPRYPPVRTEEALHRYAHVIEPPEPASPQRIAHLLQAGQIVARCAGRSEFGPRALGGRSLLGSPLLASTKDRLNAIKGRQSWRPVAPIILREWIGAFFAGPQESPYMSFAQSIREPYREALAALRHPDASTRAQTLERSDDPDLYEMLEELERLTGFPIVVNTSLNGPGQPIVETPEEALQFLLAHPDVDALWLEGRLVRRASRPSWTRALLAPDTLINILYLLGKKRIFLVRHEVFLEISPVAWEWIERQQEGFGESGAPGSSDLLAISVADELDEAVRRGLLIPV
jgi:carbamoyltransferase